MSEDSQQSPIGDSANTYYSYLQDIRIECILDQSDSEHRVPKLLSVEVFNSSSLDGEELPFEIISEKEWKSDACIILPNEITILAQFNVHGNKGIVHFKRDEFESFTSRVCTVPSSRDFTNNAKEKNVWRLKFEIRTSQPQGKVQFALAENTQLPTKFDEAVATQQALVLSTPLSDSEDLSEYLNNLGITLTQRFKHASNLADIDNAISSFRQAIEIANDTYILMPLYHNNLGNAFDARYELARDMQDLIASILAHRKAAELSPDGDSSKSEYLSTTADALLKCYEHTQNTFYLNMAILFFSRSATYGDGDPDERLVAVERWVELSEKHEPSQVLAAYSTAIGLVSEIGRLSQTIQVRYQRLARISRLSTSSAATALRLGRTDLALEWLERGRGLVWTQLNNLRSPFPETFGEEYPEIAAEILKVSEALDKAGTRMDTWLSPRSSTSIVRRSQGYEDNGMTVAHIKLSEDWERLLSDVRALPGFEGFLKQLSHVDLLNNLPACGYVIIVNVHEERCDALVLRHGTQEPQHIPLPEFSFGRADNLRLMLKQYLHGSGVRVRGDLLNLQVDTTDRGMRRSEGGSGRVLENILRDLWNSVVKPILVGIGYPEPPSDLIRIWWCATGPLAFLPIHAAGIFSGLTTEAVLDYAISSYIPTVQTLVERVKKPLIRDPQKSCLLMISQSDTPGQKPIPNTLEEVDAIQRVLKRKGIPSLSLQSSAATSTKALSYMSDYSCIHLACHASQNDIDPLKSGFYLYDGQLDFSSIIQRDLIQSESGADLAFLSACQTSAGDEELSEEAVHLAAGMLAAGYRGVVATMWSIQDQYGPEISENFYGSLLGSSDSSELNGKWAAQALHFATRNLREKLGDSEASLIAWVPYVHFGL